jgi:hypothetical protein
MARTYVPDPGPIDGRVTKKSILDRVHEQLLIAMGDYDKCDAPEDCAYYGGLVDAYHDIEKHMTKEPREENTPLDETTH